PADVPAANTRKPADARALTEVALPAAAAGPHSARADNLLAISPTHVASVNTPAFTPGWQDEMLGKLAHVVLSRHERAELKLNPGELGPVAVRIEMHADQAAVTIVAASPDTRSALEQSLPQLRDLLAAQGITLGQASVQDGSAQRDATPQGAPAPRNGAQEPSDGGERMHAVQLIARRPDRLVDVFA
ncbi:MAG: flagellar hook-length control protein FliK, partial [Casimicrobiaceae bacterium]